MADADKNILITPNRGSSTADPKIEFTGGDNNKVTLTTLDDGTLSVSGSAGQLFSISDSLTGTIFSVNDVSGIPSIEVDDDGTVRLAEFGGDVHVGKNIFRNGKIIADFNTGGGTSTGVEYVHGQLTIGLNEGNDKGIVPDSPTDGQVLSWDDALQEMKWIAGGGGGGGGQWEFISEVVVSSSVTAVNVPTNLTNPTYGEVFKLEIINASLSGSAYISYNNDAYFPSNGHANWYSDGSSSGMFTQASNQESGLKVKHYSFDASAKTNITLEFMTDNVGWTGTYHKGSGVTYEAWNSSIFQSSGFCGVLAPSTIGIRCSSIASGTFRLYKLAV